MLMVLAAVMQAASAQQLSNTTFDGGWVDCYPWEAGATVSSARGTQPSGWCISNVSQSALPIVGEEVTPGANGSGKAVKLSNVSASIGSNTAPGYITLGTAWATAETKMTSVRNADGGVFGGIAFTYHPDAVRFTYKHDVSNGTENMSVIAYLWKGTWTQKEVPSNTAVGILSWGEATKVTMTDRIQNILGRECLTGGEVSKTSDAALIAYAEYNSSVSHGDWVTREIPLDYGDYAGKQVTVEKLNIVVSSNGFFDDRSTIKAGNSVTVDDVELVYYHALTALSFEGASLDFSEGTTDYDLSSFAYDEAKLSYTVKGQGAKVIKNYEGETGVLTIRVQGEDFAVNASSFTEYKLQFQPGDIDPEKPVTKTYPTDLYVTIAGETGDKQDAQIIVETHTNGNINFVLKNFVLNAGDDMMPIGNIVVENLEVAADGTFAYKGGIQLAEGDDPAYTGQWYGPMVTSMAGGSVPIDLSGRFLDENSLMVYISINMENSVGYKVIVHLGYTRATMKVKAEDQYGTFCAPFAVTLPSSVQAYTVDAASPGGLLTLTKVNFFLPANTPVVVFAENGLSMTEFYGLPEDGTPVNGMLTGVYEDTNVPAGSYVLQNNSGRMGFYQATSGQTVAANRCYLTSSAGVSAFYFEAEAIAGHVPFSFTQDLFAPLRYDTYGGSYWDDNGGIRLGNSSEIFNWSNKYYVMSIAGIPDKLSFNYSSSTGASSRQYVIYESADGVNFTEIWRDNKGSGIDGNTYNSGDIQLSPDTRFIKFFYYGNCAAYYREVRVTELVKFACDKSSITLDDKKQTDSFTFIHANASPGIITVTAPEGISVTVSEMVGGIDIYEEQTIGIGFENTNDDVDVDDDIVISNGTQTVKVHLKAHFEGDGIADIREDKAEEAVYNLAGQRIGKLQKGINIVGGKKVLK